MQGIPSVYAMNPVMMMALSDVKATVQITDPTEKVAGVSVLSFTIWTEVWSWREEERPHSLAWENISGAVWGVYYFHFSVFTRCLILVMKVFLYISRKTFVRKSHKQVRWEQEGMGWQCEWVGADQNSFRCEWECDQKNETYRIHPYTHGKLQVLF